jgi:pSer/pThr/pTyr-binding forkhead associated (FHA) protein
MSQAAIQPRTGFRFMLTVRDGPDAGASFQLLPPKVTIGRGPENNVVLNDSRMSRSAAVVDFAPDKITVTDLSSRPSLAVNGELYHAASIKDGDVIQIGSTQFLFVVEALVLAPPSPPESAGLSVVKPFPTAQGSPLGQTQGFSTQPLPRPTPKVSSNSRLPMYIVVIIVGGLLASVLVTNKVAQLKERQLRTAEDIEKDTKMTEERTEVLIKKRTFANDEEKTRFEEAQKHYLEGFRDYQEHQWARAMKSFETASAIDPEHELARRYYKLAEKQRDEMTADLSIEGRRYKDKHMYARCSSALEKAMIAIPNKDDLKYKEIEALKKECDLLMDSQFQ